MKLFLIAFAVIAVVAADVSHLPSNEYLPPTQQYQSVEQAHFQTPSNDYLPPVQQHVEYQSATVEAEPAHVLADDGYRYKTHRRRVIRRNRRDVSHLPLNEYLPPTEHHEHVEQVQFQTPSNEYLAPVQEHHASVAQYQAPVTQYQTVQYQAPVAQQVQYQPTVEAEPAHVLADDGYRYRTNRRRVIRRNRRDVSHLPLNEYLPPTEHHEHVEHVQFQTPSNDYLPPVQEHHASVAQYQAPATQYQTVQYQAPVAVEAAPAHVLADDGYRYKTHRRRVIRRNRRDVSHLPSNEYLPPTQHVQAVHQVQQFQAPTNEYLPPVQQVQQLQYQAPVATYPQVQYQAPVAAYPQVQYQAPVQEYQQVQYQAPVQEYQQVQYQAPVQEYQQVQYQAPVQEYQQVQFQAPAVEAEPAHELAEDGYRYKTQRRRVYRRNRRDVSHLPTSEYLPPSNEISIESTPTFNYSPVQEVQQVEQVQQVQIPAPVEAEPAHVLADDGYRYKTHRRVVYRRH